MTIKKVEGILGIKRETIRYYIQEGLVSPRQKENGYRMYSDEDIDQLKRIMILRQLEVSIADIRAVIRGEKDLASVLDKSKEVLDVKSEYVQDAIRICKDLIQSNDSEFDPKPYFKDYKAV